LDLVAEIPSGARRGFGFGAGFGHREHPFTRLRGRLFECGM